MANEIHYSDHLERSIGEALIAAGIKFEKNQRLDFYLPDYDLYIEVKAYHSERSLAQLASQDNVILVQGKPCVDFLVKLVMNLVNKAPR